MSEVDAGKRAAITVSIMLATIMTSLDATIANVALPHIQGSVSASPEQITWVLTSYIVASAIMTPLVGWLAGRVGRKHIFVLSIVGFTITSMLCGLSTNLAEIVAFRLLQGVFGAALIPLSQSVLLDIYPRHRHGQAMAIWSSGALLGPILGPVLGGYLTQALSWRWCFYINLPVGILTLIGVLVFIAPDLTARRRPFDFLGFGALSLFVGALQMFLDRGPSQDWFASREVWGELLLAVIGLWVFVIQTLTAEHPFLERDLIRDRNFLTANILGFFVGALLFSTVALLPTMTQSLLGYPVLTSGLSTMPRGVGSLLSMIFVGRLIGRVDTRALLGVGLAISSVAIWQMTKFDLSMTFWPVILSGGLQGFGLGLVFTPMTTLAFATISPDLRSEGSAIYNLVRNLGSSVGISIMQGLLVANTQAVHSSLSSQIIASDSVVRSMIPAQFDPSTTVGLVALNGEVTRQATMVAYVDDFKLMLIVTLACIPMLIFMRPPRPSGPGSREPMEVDKGMSLPTVTE